MSTRSTTHFLDGSERPVAIVYRHTDGYPDGAGVDLHRFLEAVEAQTNDTRFGDPSYLAAKYVVWLAAMFAPHSAPYTLPREEREAYGETHPLAFLSVGIMSEDPPDAAYRYTVSCHELGPDGRPAIRCYEIEGGWDESTPTTYREVPVPAAEEVASDA